MSLTKPDSALIVKAAQLARSSPGSWSDFLNEFRNYADRVKDQCIASPPDALQISAGRARMVMEILELFKECVTAADKIAASRK